MTRLAARPRLAAMIDEGTIKTGGNNHMRKCALQKVAWVDTTNHILCNSDKRKAFGC